MARITLQVDVMWPAAEATCSDGVLADDVLLLVEANGQTIAVLEYAPPLQGQRKISKQFQFGAPDAPGFTGAHDASHVIILLLSSLYYTFLTDAARAAPPKAAAAEPTSHQSPVLFAAATELVQSPP